MIPKSLLLTAAALIAGCLPSANGDGGKAYAWVEAQQRPTGLVRNQLDDHFSGLYVDALAAFCYLHEGKTERAEQMFDTLEDWRSRQWGTTLDKQGFPQAWNADNGRADMASDRWVGDNAWLLLALEYHHQKTGNDKYSIMRGAIADWLVALQDEADGGVKAGFNKNGPMNHKSTEGNLDCYAALGSRPEARMKVRRWLTEDMWIPAESRFRTGSTEDSTALDCVSWGVATLGKDYASALKLAEEIYIITAPMEGLPGKTATGFGDLPGRKRVWFEGTGEMIVAYRAAGRDADALKWIAEMDKVALEIGPDHIGWPCSSNDPAWNGASTRAFVASNAWYLFGLWNFNPMNPSSWNETQSNSQK